MKEASKAWFAPVIASVVLLASCATPSTTSFEQGIAERTQPTTSYETYAKTEPKLKRLKPGSVFSAESIGLRRFTVTKQFSGESRAVALADGWISAMSGGGFALGRAIGTDGNMIYGRHVFGYVYGNRTLVPKYELRTKTSIVSDAEYQEMKQQGRDQDILAVSFGKEGKNYYFNRKNVTIDVIRALPFVGLPEIAHDEAAISKASGLHAIYATTGAEAEHALPDMGKGASWVIQEAQSGLKESLQTVYTKASFEEAEQQLKRLPAGIDRWEMIHQLNGLFTTRDYGQGYALYMKGYANKVKEDRWQLATEGGVFEVWPFGYFEGDTAFLKHSVIFLNGKLQRIVPYEPESSLAPRLREQP